MGGILGGLNGAEARWNHFAIPQRKTESAEVVLYDHARNNEILPIFKIVN